MASSQKSNAFKDSLKVRVPNRPVQSSSKKNAFNSSPSIGQRERTRTNSNNKSKGMSR